MMSIARSLGFMGKCFENQNVKIVHWRTCCFSEGMWKGLFPRIIMIGTLTALQWFIYDGVKVFFRLPRPPPPEMPESLKKKLAESH
jgi:hypothetical protein